MAVASSQLPVASKSEKPECTCGLQIPEYRGWRCKFWEERSGQEICNHKHGPIFCHTGGRESQSIRSAGGDACATRES